MPSAASGPLNSSSESARIRSNAVDRSRPGTSCSSRLVSATARGAPATIPAHSARGRRRDVVGDVRDQSDRAGLVGVERLAGQHRGGDPARRDPPQDRHGDDRRRHADPHLGERERDRPVHDDQVARRHQPDAAGAHRAADCGDGRLLGVHQPFEDADHRCRVGRAGRSLLQVGAGAERGPLVRQHDDADAGGRLDLVESLTELGDELARQRVAVVLRVERDRRDPCVDTKSDDLIGAIWSGSGSTPCDRSQSAPAPRVVGVATRARRNSSASARCRVRRIGGSARTMSHR